MKPIAKAHGMDEPPHDKFRCGIFRLHRRHDARALGFADIVSHFLTLFQPLRIWEQSKPVVISRNTTTAIVLLLLEIIMNSAEKKAIMDDFLAWSGGIPPDSPFEIFTYVELASLPRPDKGEIWLLLKDWMEKVWQQDPEIENPFIRELS